jgi:hypothetical protein
MTKLCTLTLAALALSACGTRSGDAHHDAGPIDTLGTGARIREVRDPSLPNHPVGSGVTITGAAVVAVDSYDETKDGNSIGTVHLQDPGSHEAWSGVSLFKPTFNPANLKLAEGDILDLEGTYQENNTIGTTVKFDAGEYLPQVATPQVRFRFEASKVEPTVIQATDLNKFDTGRQWIGMVVTIENVTFPGELVNTGSNRMVALITNDRSQKGATVTNELFDLKTYNDAAKTIAPGKHVKSITGVVTYFYNLHIAPRSAVDIVVQ